MRSRLFRVTTISLVTAVLCGMTGTASASPPDETGTVTGPRLAAVAAQEEPPAAPMISDQVGRDGAVRVSWHDPDPQTAEVTSYVVTAEPGGASTTVDGDSRSAIVGDLTNGTRYRMSVVAHNGFGQSEPAPPSNPVTPRPATFRWNRSSPVWCLPTGESPRCGSNLRTEAPPLRVTC
ncbi:hypothetical protein BAY61_10245 [Prauserella marina]|uniref:fibronectin type III domain-containing protein n=1 Tax=Prauserella marina TaxID=530584 RepID=UPI000B843E45|nr:fibronectin type III domain-containing protein [Prauserella marina]ASR35311.1 hypothetical protein BAY61_10245 [Prauserella marina]